MGRQSLRLAISLLGGVGLVLILSLVVRAPSQVQAAPDTIYVAPGGICNGATPCYSDIQSAVDAASSGDEIRVAAGTYTTVNMRPRNDVTRTGVVTQVVFVNKTITIRGGYTTTNWSVSNPVAYPTIVDAQDQGRVVYVTGDVQLTLEELRLTGGNARGLGGIVWYSGPVDAGAGIYALTSTVTISGCTVSGNGEPSWVNRSGGGGAYISADGTEIRNSTFSNNEAEFTAGLMLIGDGSVIEKNSFTDNDSWGGNYYGGGGVSVQGANIVVRENILINNISYGGGGLGVNGEVSVIGNTFTDNYAIYGGGIHIGGGSPLLVGNVISGNDASQAGGGISMFNCYPTCEPLFLNNVVADNTVSWSSSWGAGIFVGGGDPTLLHTSITRNTGGDGSGVSVRPWIGSVTVTMTNSILVSHTVGISVTDGNTVMLDGVLWHSTPVTVSPGAGGSVTVQHQYSGDPMFAVDGYHLSSSSAALDKGINSVVVSDIDGDTRFFGNAPDLGADEWAIIETTAEPSETATIFVTTSEFTTTILIPIAAVTESTTFRYVARALPDNGAPLDFTFAGQAFNLDAFRNTQQMVGFTFDKPVTVTIAYGDETLGTISENTLLLMYWNGDNWKDAACDSYERHSGDNWLRVPICHLSEFALFGETNNVYLPLVLRNH